MTVKLASLRRDEKRLEGEWIPSVAFPGVEWHLRPIDNEQFRLQSDMQSKRYQRKFGDKMRPLREVQQDNGRLVAETLLLGWKGLDEEYSADKALETLSDPMFAEMTNDILFCATRVAQIEVEFIEETAKN